MREGSLEAPVRYALDWQNPWFWDEAALEKEMERVFDICHGCRRCFNLCDSFPRLFDLIDNSPTGELDGVNKEDYASVEEACTLCDMCFMTKCPYVPPHAWALDFPHLMLRHRAVQAKKHGVDFVESQLADTDRTGRLGTFVSSLMNWATDETNKPVRRSLQTFTGIHHSARLPRQAGETFELRARREGAPLNEAAPAFGKRKAVLYATCFVNFHSTDIGAAALAVLAKNGVQTEVLHPACCGMPKLELGDIESVAAAARKVSAELLPWVDKGYDIVALTPSCALMLKFEWPLISPKDPAIDRLSKATFDLSEYVVDIAKKHGLAEGLEPVEGGISMHLACHARAQNMGAKGAEMLRLIPKTRVAVIERCSGHGGIWGARTENFDIAVKVGKPAAEAALKNDTSFVASECPLAGEHLMQVMEMAAGEQKPKPFRADHPIEILARAYGLKEVFIMNLRKIDASAIVPLAEYGKQRAERRTLMSAVKKNRRLEVGPFATFYFESYETMLHQIHEMLFIEKGGEEQLKDELAAYNPLIPQGSELVATVMFEIDDPVRRARVLATLGGIEHNGFIRVGGEIIRGIAEDDQERSREDGKASSVQFMRFPFTAAQIKAFRSGGGDVVVGFDHPAYGHMAVMPQAVRAALSADFD